MAHSRSCGLPKWAWTRRARVATWRAWSALIACSLDRVQPGLAVADDPLVAGGLAGHQPLAQAAHGGDDDLVAVAGHRVGGEGDPGRLGRHHHLDQDRHPGAGPGRVGAAFAWGWACR